MCVRERSEGDISNMHALVPLLLWWFHCTYDHYFIVYHSLYNTLSHFFLCIGAGYSVCFVQWMSKNTTTKPSTTRATSGYIDYVLKQYQKRRLMKRIRFRALRKYQRHDGNWQVSYPPQAISPIDLHDLLF